MPLVTDVQKLKVVKVLEAALEKARAGFLHNPAQRHDKIYYVGNYKICVSIEELAHA